MLIRIRHRGGMERFTLQPTDDIQLLVDKILEKVPTITRNELTLSNEGPGINPHPVEGLTGSLKDMGISHGDLLFAGFPDHSPPAPPPPPTEPTPSSSSQPSTSQQQQQPSTSKPWETAPLDAVDVYWSTQDGLIPRSRDSRMCRHGPKGMCDFCMPLEPFDSSYLTSHGIKHLSYHSYVRKLLSSNPPSRESSNYLPPLSNPDYRVKIPCPSRSHADYPKGICTKCQPSAITLAHQTYRTVDHVEFASPKVLDGMIDFWRRMGTQRFGFLLGRLERYNDVPMGVKAVVEAIHEPLQEGMGDGLVVGLPWEDESRVRRLAQMAGLEVLGMIYTDLTPDADDRAKVVHKRHVQSYFLSSLEAVFSARMQAKHRMPSQYADTGSFSSRFLTVVLSGNAEGGIEAYPYLLSDQAMGLVEADLLEASVEPGTMRIKMGDGSEEEGGNGERRRYVPDVFHRYKNEYGKDVQESAKPCFPVEYLLVTLSQGAPIKPAPVFITETAFPIESRAGMDDQSELRVAKDVRRLVADLPKGYETVDLGKDSGSGAGPDGEGQEVVPDLDALLNVVRWLSDWHLLNFLDQTAWFDHESMTLAARIATTHDLSLLGPFFRTVGWGNLVACSVTGQEPSPVDRTSDLPPLGSGGAGGGGGGMEGVETEQGAVQPCPHCTYAYNEPGWDACAVCTLPPTW